jgi:hypothetical protein
LTDRFPVLKRHLFLKVLTLEVLSKNDIQVEVLQTEAAAERFNELRENIAVGGLFHSTC